MCLFVAAILGFVAVLLMHFTSDCYYGQQYTELVNSKYLTDSEKKALWDDAYAISALPKEYNKSPKLVKERLKRNQEIVRMRRREANANKGKFSTDTPIVH